MESVSRGVVPTVSRDRGVSGNQSDVILGLWVDDS